MLAGLVIFAFAGGFGTAVYVIGTTVARRLDQIVAALRGVPVEQFAPLATLARAENRIAVRRWAAHPSRVSARMRAVA